MNVKAFGEFVTRNAGRRLLVAQKHSPTIMFAAGVVGVVATVVMASKATLKLEEVLDEAKGDLDTAKELHESDTNEYSDLDYKRDVTVVYARAVHKMVKLYGPAFIVGSASIACLAGSNQILSRRNASLTAAYVALEKSYDEYRRRVIGEVGEDKERKLRFGVIEREILEEKETGEPEVKIIRSADPNVRSPYAKFFDEVSPNWSREANNNLLFLRCQQQYFNDILRARGHVFLNEVYDALGIERTRAGSVVGWVVSKEGDNYIDFGIFDGENPRARDFVNGREMSILLDFNVDGIIYDKI